MKFSRNDYFVFSVGVTIICIFSVLFIFDYTAKSGPGVEKVVGSITYKKRVALRKYAEQVIWEEIEQKTPVYNNDSIRTAEMSEAVIQLIDGTEIAINENSMILLSFTKSEIDIQFRGGSIVANRNDVEASSVTKLNIKSGETTVSVNKSDIKVSGEKDKEINLTVTKGNATVTSGQMEKKVEENQKVVVSENRKEIMVFDIPLKQQSPSPESIFILTAKPVAVDFSWVPLDDKQPGFIDIASDSNFGRIVSTRKMVGSSLRIFLDEGTYFWRLRAKNPGTGKNDYSDSWRLKVIKESPAYLISPPNGETMKYAKTMPVIHFKWSTSQFADTYRLIVASDRQMKNIIKSSSTAANTISIDTMPEGDYFWKVVTTVNIDGKKYETASDIYSLIINKKMSVASPRPVYPANNQEIDTLLIRKKGLLFSWDSEREIERTMIYVSSDPQFYNIIFKGDVPTNFADMVGELKEGRYYWKLTGYLKGNEKTEPSKIFSFDVVSGGNITLQSPPDGNTISSDAISKFTWNKTDIYANYTLQVSVNRNFSILYKYENVTTPYALISGFKPGVYYWRVLLRDDDGNVIMTSNPRRLLVTDELDKPRIISPQNGYIVNLTVDPEILLMWDTIKGADVYTIRLYRIANNRNILISEKNTAENRLALNEKDLLPESQYLWLLQALEKGDGDGGIIRKSPVARSYFQTRIQKILDKPKIISPKILFIE